MSTQIEFKPFQIRGKNISNRLREYGIDKVPTLYFPDKMAKVEGYQNIARYLGVELTMENQPTQRFRKNKKDQKKKRPKLEPKYQKAIIESDSDDEVDDDENEDDEFEDDDEFDDDDDDVEDEDDDVEDEDHDVEDSDEISLEV